MSESPSGVLQYDISELLFVKQEWKSLITDQLMHAQTQCRAWINSNS